MSKASVIIPVYKTERFLAKCLDSILQQTYQDFDIICINDCSPDDSQRILDAYVDKYPDKIRCLVNEQNMGQGRSRMRGVELSESEYIFFVDSDDYLAPDYLETFLAEVKTEPLDLVIAGFTKDIDGKYVQHDIVKNDWTMVCYPVACCKMYRRQFIVDHHIDFSDVRRGEDIYFSVAAFCCQPRVRYIRYFGYYYLLNTNSTTGSMNANSKHERAVSDMFTLLLERFPVRQLRKEQRQMVEYAYIANMINALITYDHGCRPSKMKEKYDFFLADLNDKFPEWKKNPHYRYFGFEGPNNKIKLGVCLTMNLLKAHLAWPIYWLISWI